MGSFGLSINPPAASNIDSVAGPGMMHDPLNRGDFPESRVLIDDGGRPAQGTKFLVDRFTGEDARFCSLPENLGHEPFLRLWEKRSFACCWTRTGSSPS